MKEEEMKKGNNQWRGNYISTGHHQLEEQEDDYFNWAIESQENIGERGKQRGTQGSDPVGHCGILLRIYDFIQRAVGSHWRLSPGFNELNTSITFVCLFVISQNVGQSELEVLPDVLSPEKFPWASKWHFWLSPTHTVCLPPLNPVTMWYIVSGRKDMCEVQWRESSAECQW